MSEQRDTRAQGFKQAAVPVAALTAFLAAGFLADAIVNGRALGWHQSAAGKKAAEMAASFAPFAPSVKTHADNRTFYIESNGIPRHPMMVGIKSWQQQVPLPQEYTGSNAWQVPLFPKPAAVPLSGKEHFFRGAMAIAADGIPIFNALNNRGEDSNKIGELDNWGGHCGRADDYHYHVAPTILSGIVGKTHPIAYALDGYALYGYTEPDGSLPGKLDAFNGHTTAALGYHYHATKEYPYLNGGFHGEVTEIEGQADPQPSARPVRPATPPLRGASISKFAELKPGQYTLTYVLDGKEHVINYSSRGNGVYHFDYIDANGEVTPRDYQGGRTLQQGVGQGFGQGDRGTPQPGPGGGEGGGPRGGPREAPFNAAEEISRPIKGFVLSSPVVGKDGVLPTEYTGDGAGISPPLRWAGAPEGTKSFVVIMHHIDPQNLVKVYWTLYNLPATVTSLAADHKGVGSMGHNTMNNRNGYAPPHSKGPGLKTYTITVYALRDMLTLPGTNAPDRASLLAAMRTKADAKPLVLATAELKVNCTRQPGAGE